MPLVKWKDLTPAQKVEAVNLRPRWHPTDFPNFAFWVKSDGHVSRRGGHHQMTQEAYDAFMAKFKGQPRTKGDLRDWKPGTTFHFGHG